MKAAEGKRVKDCQDPWTGVTIGANGDVSPCCHALQRMGNVGEEEFDDIWTGPRFRTFRTFLKSTTPLPVCSTCFVRPWRAEPVSPRQFFRGTWSWLVRTAGTGRQVPRLRVWSDREIHRPGEPMSLSLGLEAGRLLDGGHLDLYLIADDPTGSRHFLVFAGRFVQHGPHPAPLLGNWEPLSFEWLEVRMTPPRDLPRGTWLITAVLTPAGGNPDVSPERFATASCSFVEEA